ncbi:porin [Paraburkholderia acidisoli]|uniref:Porin n=2 Tax=Paraburkholderia acidisoli TaxID=2571748 RepID=A0A7Z2GPW5_9BURK|nr:porin [Paraburkholderia acidisoli]
MIPVGLLGLAAAGAAHAQSTVTLFGVIDQGISYTSNAGGHNQWSMAGGVLQGSRWGLRGSEDLGGGLKAIFLLESGFDASSGKFTQGGLLFGRRAFVGLADAHVGTVTLGRQYDDVVDYVGVFADRAFGGGYVAAHPGDIDNFNNGYRTNNSIKYESANYSGLHFGGMYSLGGVAGEFTRNQTYSLGAGYEHGPFSLAAAYMNVRNPNISFFGNSSTSAPSTGAANIASPVYSGFASARTYQVIAAGGAYRIGAATLGATWSNIQFTHLGDTAESGVNPSGYRGSAHFNNAEVNVQYQFTPAFSMTAAYDYMKGSSVSSATGQNGGATYHQGALSADYLLSKRTDVYIMGVYQHASGTDSRNQPAVAAINGLTASTSSSQATVHVGLRHRF